MSEGFGARDGAIRPATVEDVEAIRAVAAESWHDTYDETLGPDAVEAALADWYDPETLAEQITTPTDVFLLTVEDGDVIGYGNGGPDSDREDVHHLWRLYVAPDSLGEGIGTALLNAVEERLSPGRDVLELTVLAANRRAREFYEARGFELVDRKPTTVASESIVECVYCRPLGGRRG